MRRYWIVVLVFLLFLCCCKKESGLEESVVAIEVTTPKKELVRRVDDFQIDDLWIDVTYENGIKKQFVCTKDMIREADLKKLSKVGNHTIHIEYGSVGTDIEIYLYNEEIIKDKQIFVWNEQNETKVALANTIYEIEPIDREGLFFYNWYRDETCEVKYEELPSDEVVMVYPKYIAEQTYRVRFYHEKVLIKEEYVKEGESATPPIMKSTYDYVFSHWDKPFTDIHENVDIYSVYESGACEVIFYNLAGEAISRQVIKKGASVVPPVLPQEEGFIFVSWDHNLESITSSCEIYPIYNVMAQMIRVRYFRNTMDDFLYEQYYLKGDPIEFQYDFGHYEILGFSEDLSAITTDTDVIVSCRPEEVGYYIDDVLVAKLPFYSQPPQIPYLKNMTGVWQQSNSDPLRFDLVYNPTDFGYPITLVTDMHGSMSCVMKDFLNYGPAYYVGCMVRTFELYEWYWDPFRSQKIEDFNEVKEDAVIYGKRIEETNISIEDYFVLTKTQTSKGEGWRVSFKIQPPIKTIYIPDEYEGLPILEVTKETLAQPYYFFIGKNLKSIFGTSVSNQALGYFVNWGNSDFYDDSGVLYQSTVEEERLAMYPCGWETAEFVLQRDFKVEEDVFKWARIDNFIVAEGFTILENLDFSDTDIYTFTIPSTLVELRVNALGKNVRRVVFLPNSHLEYFNIDISYNATNAFIELPDTVRFLDQSSYSGSNQRCLIHISENNPYLIRKDMFVLTKDEETLCVAFYQEDIVIPEYVRYVFTGCFNNLKINKVVFHSELEDVMSYNGYRTLKGLEYDNFIGSDVTEVVVPKDSTLKAPPSIISTSWVRKNRSTELVFGVTLIRLYGIIGDYIISKDVRIIPDFLDFYETDIDTVYIPLTVEEVSMYAFTILEVKNVVYLGE